VLNLFERATQTKRIVDIAAPNWAEVRYRIAQKLGKDGWRQAQDTLLGFPLEIVPADRTLAEFAGEFKLTRKMSLADCFAAALAKQRNAELYTGDPDFRAVEKDIRIVWL
jgi:predicted nucleic acid-binding protein